MGNLDLTNDLGAPAIVTVVNIAAKQSTMQVMGQPISDVLTYVMAGGGYLAAYMGWGGKHSQFLKNIAIAAAPLAFEKIYNKVKGGTGARVAHPLTMTRVGRYPAPTPETNFQGMRLV